MEHPGVKNLLDRIFKQNGGHPAKANNNSSPKQVSASASSASGNACDDGLTIVFDEPAGKKLSTGKGSERQSSNAFTNFKENLRQRMKARRQEIRKEEEEDDQIDEEYHGTIKKDDDPESEDEVGEENYGPKKVAISDDDEESDEDEDTCGRNEEQKGSGDEADSDNDFQLNLNEDDEEESESEIVLNKNHHKKLSKANRNKAGVDHYAFDEDDTCDSDVMSVHQANRKSKTSLNGGDIPLTNTIPSNQPKNNDYDFNSQEYLEGTQFVMDKQQRRSLDEITNISFNYESTTQNPNASSNTINSFKSKASSTANLTILNQDEEANDGIDDFDELAMLCSGQFKETGSGDGSQNKKSSPIDLSKLIEKEDKKNESADNPKKSPIKLKLSDNDLYAADDSEDEDELKKKSTSVEFFNTNSNSNSNDIEGTEASTKTADKEDSEDEEEEIGTKIKKKAVVEDDEEEMDDDEIVSSKDDSNDVPGEETKKMNAFDAMKQKKKFEEEALDSEEELERQGFVEEEACLSGSEEDPDENDEGDSGEDDSIVYSGDESELPGAGELQDQLGKIYRKEQNDEEKRQLRMFKEMYLGDGEREKDARKKQFRWKNADDYIGNNRFDSSSEEEDGEDEDEDDESSKDTDKEAKKNEKYMKRMENRNWRMNRHEREEFIKLKANAETLLSDDELQELEEMKKKKKSKHYDDDSDTEYTGDDSCTAKKVESSAQQGTSLFKMGQQLLKKKINPLNKSEQNKRALNGDMNAISRLETMDELSALGGNPEVNNGASKPLAINNQENLLKKFSFLNKDKGYLSKLSNYVNKNFANVESAQLAKTKPKNSTGMVFTKIDLNGLEDEENSKDPSVPYMNSSAVNRSSALINKEREEDNDCTTSKISITPTPKRVKLDTCESIFNHIN